MVFKSRLCSVPFLLILVNVVCWLRTETCSNVILSSICYTKFLTIGEFTIFSSSRLFKHHLFSFLCFLFSVHVITVRGYCYSCSYHHVLHITIKWLMWKFFSCHTDNKSSVQILHDYFIFFCSAVLLMW